MIITLLTSFTTQLIFATNVVAKTSSSLKPKLDPADPLKLYLNPYDTAFFSFYVIFAGCTFFQISSAMREVRDEKVHRAPYILSSIAVSLYLASYIMRGIAVSKGRSERTGFYSNHPDAASILVSGSLYSAISGLLIRLAHLVLTGGVFLMVYQRTQRFANRSNVGCVLPTWKKVIDVFILLSGVGFAAAYCGLRASLIWTSNLSIRIDHLATIFPEIFVVDLICTGVFVSIRMNRARFFDGYIQHIIKFITPLLLVYALNEILYVVLSYLPYSSGANKINYTAYSLAYVIIRGFSGIATIHLFHGLYKQADQADIPLKPLTSEQTGLNREY